MSIVQPIVIPMEDEITHTEANGFRCCDPTCPCQEEEDDFYEPPYTRADEMADQATADYYDEVARRGPRQ